MLIAISIDLYAACRSQDHRGQAQYHGSPLAKPIMHIQGTVRYGAPHTCRGAPRSQSGHRLQLYTAGSCGHIYACTQCMCIVPLPTARETCIDVRIKRGALSWPPLPRFYLERWPLFSWLLDIVGDSLTPAAATPMPHAPCRMSRAHVIASHRPADAVEVLELSRDGRCSVIVACREHRPAPPPCAPCPSTPPPQSPAG